jgi:hypothetical protein
MPALRDRIHRAAFPSSLAFPAQPKSRRRAQTGFMKSSTMASASWLGATPRACGSTRAMATISLTASRASSKPSQACRCNHASSTARPSCSMSAASRPLTGSATGNTTVPQCSNTSANLSRYISFTAGRGLGRKAKRARAPPLVASSRRTAG